MNKKEFEMMNQKLIDGYIDRQKNHAHMLDDDSYPDAKKHRMILPLNPTEKLSHTIVMFQKKL